MRQYILVAQTQTLTCDASGKASAGTVSIWDRGNTLLVDEASVTTLGASTTLNGSAGYSQTDPRLVPVTSETGFSIGDGIKLTDGYNRAEYGVIDGTSTGYLVLEAPLQRDYASGHSVETLQVKYTIASTIFETATSDCQTNCRARFTLTISGNTEIHDVAFDVVASPVDQPITVENLHQWDPQAISDLPSTIPDWSSVLEKAWERTIHYLEASGLYPQYAVDDDQFALLHSLAFRWKLAEMGINPDSSYIAGGAIGYFRSEFFATLETLKTKWMDTDSDLSIGTDEENKQRRVEVII